MEGKLSDELDISNSVFQDTVLGPVFWIMFFADVASAASSGGGEKNIFVDDLSVFQFFVRLRDEDEVKTTL